MAARVSERSAASLGVKTQTRAGTRKSRSGCAACKTKRLKCDEIHPSCNQCTKRGKPCPGYSRQYRWSLVHEKILPAEQTTEFWPQAEHDALLDSLPQPRVYEAQIQNLAPEPQRNGPAMIDPALSSPVTVLPTPGTEDDIFATEQISGRDIDGGDGAEIHGTTDADDFVSLPTITDDAWFDDPFVLLDNDVTISEIFSDLSRVGTSGESGRGSHEGRGALGGSTRISALTPPKLLYTPIDLSTMLMEHWFSDVCAMWSAYDSPSNPHRQLASSAWQHSQAVYFALQSMSAACLVDSLPHVKKHIGVLSSQAVEAIQSGVTAHKQLAFQSKAAFPRELLLAIIAMGTSVCWTDTRQLGLWFLGKAHELLTQYEDEGLQLDASGRQELEYFREALVYWEMLYRVVGFDPRGHLKKRKEVYRRRLLRAMSAEASPPQDSNLESETACGPPSSGKKNISIHPWTGVSTEIQNTFGLVALLCRDHRLTERKRGKRTTASLTDALCDIKMAQDLMRELAETDVYAGDHTPSPETSSKGTGDTTTPVQHLVDTAEAYRLAALLLLCQTFSDLDMGQVTPNREGSYSDTQHRNKDERSNVALGLAMRLVETLRRVPIESNSRCIQPILFIIAGSGMRFRDTPGESSIQQQDGGYAGPPSHNHLAPSSNQSAQLDMALFSGTHHPAIAEFKNASLTSCTLEVSRGRRFVVDRLCALQRSLPPRPIGVALDLVKAIWAEYDYHAKDDVPHWIDVMIEKNFQTLFG